MQADSRQILGRSPNVRHNRYFWQGCSLNRAHPSCTRTLHQRFWHGTAIPRFQHPSLATNLYYNHVFVDTLGQPRGYSRKPRKIDIAGHLRHLYAAGNKTLRMYGTPFVTKSQAFKTTCRNTRRRVKIQDDLQAYTTSCKLTKAPHLLFKTMHVKNKKKKKGEKEKKKSESIPWP